MDILQLPPDKLDQLPDFEEIYEYILKDSLPREEQSKSELHYIINENELAIITFL